MAGLELTEQNLVGEIESINRTNDVANRKLIVETRASLFGNNNFVYVGNPTIASVALWGIHGPSKLREEFGDTLTRLEGVAGEIIVKRQEQIIREGSKNRDPIIEVGRLADATIDNKTRNASWLFKLAVGDSERYYEKDYTEKFAEGEGNDSLKGNLLVAVEPVLDKNLGTISLWKGFGAFSIELLTRSIPSREVDLFSVGRTEFVQMAGKLTPSELASSEKVVEDFINLQNLTLDSPPKTVDFYNITNL